MTNLSFESVYYENERLKKLKDEGIIFTPDNYNTIDKRLESEHNKEIRQKDWVDKRVFITGITGFAGSHLAEKLILLGAQVYGLVRRHAVPYHPNLKGIQNDQNLFLVEGDLTSPPRIGEILGQIEPSNIFHLAAESFVPTSFKEPTRVINVNVGGTTNLMEAVKDCFDNPRISVACSSEQYGLINPEEVPVDESQPFRPRSVYGTTKIATEYIAKIYNKAYGLKTLISRAFNNEGPRRGLQFVTTVIHKQMVMLKHGLTDKIVVGNPNAVRDFTHIEDMIRAYLLLHTKGTTFVLA